MVGLSILLESKKCPQIINKMAILGSPSTSSSTSLPPHTNFTAFLDVCLYCQKRLSPKKDIFMYKGDRAFCSEDCRCRHIFMDEERVDTEKCGLVASSASSSSSSSPAADRGKESGHRVGSLFAY